MLLRHCGRDVFGQRLSHHSRGSKQRTSCTKVARAGEHAHMASRRILCTHTKVVLARTYLRATLAQEVECLNARYACIHC